MLVPQVIPGSEASIDQSGSNMAEVDIQQRIQPNELG